MLSSFISLLVHLCCGCLSKLLGIPTTIAICHFRDGNAASGVRPVVPTISRHPAILLQGLRPWLAATGLVSSHPVPGVSRSFRNKLHGSRVHMWTNVALDHTEHLSA